MNHMHLLYPKAGDATPLSATDERKMRRIMTPRADGSLLVPPEIWKQWKDLREGGRQAVTKLWNQSGKDKDP